MKKLIIGLGNPGKKYQATRHNLGFMAIEAYLNAFPELRRLRANAHLHCKLSENPGLILAQPTTFMNNSASAIESIIDYYKLDRTKPDTILELHDDLDIPFGQIKIQKGHGSAGHKGVISTMEVLPHDSFWRMRIGIAGATKDTTPGDAYVLSTFSREENAALPAIMARAVEAMQTFLTEGPEKAAQIYNQKP
ncbi:MAG: aminoacyl-tRNA hydrolase [Patescibacteria group bacterium]|nr:aminoacyl-tRNA hydrolase [Patescibacteria group bacterium]MDD5715718.1 aminoacyl-tRNA hydrolase [Patescibacteria group bacterium]